MQVYPTTLVCGAEGERELRPEVEESTAIVARELRHAEVKF